MAASDSFYDVLTRAVNDLTEHGFDSVERLQFWQDQLRRAAERSMTPPTVLQRMLNEALRAIYRRLVEKGGALKYHRGVERFTLARVAPHLRSELDRRILASADLIKLNREQTIARTLQRFSGWATSIPKGGSEQVRKTETKENIRRGIAGEPFESRRVLIDQGHKLTAAINQTIAEGGGALALVWRSHWRQVGYDYREDHKERDGQVYLLRGTWAQERGLIKPGQAGYYDAVTAVGEEVFCLPGDSKVPFADGVEKCFRRWYSGMLITLVTASGCRIRATPNHPVLTPDGWVAVGALKEGDHVVEAADQPFFALEEYEDYPVTTMVQIFGALQENGVIESFYGRAANFHGDGTDSDVDVVNAARPLSFDWKIERFERSQQFTFSMADVAGSLLGAAFFGDNGVFGTAKRVVRFSRQTLSALRSFLGHADQGGLVPAPRFATCGPEVFDDDSPRHVITSREPLDALSGNVQAYQFNRVGQDDPVFGRNGRQRKTGGIYPIPEGGDVDAEDWRDLRDGKALRTQTSKVVEVNRRSFSGHVFNLQTRGGWYVAQNIITHNCRCYATFLYNLRDLPKDLLTELGKRELARVKIVA